MNAFKIEKGIPTPNGYSKGYTAVLRDMKVNDSFFIPEKVAPKNVRSTLYTSSYRLGIKITIRGSDRGLRIWRTK